MRKTNSTETVDHDRRRLLTAAAVAGAASLLPAAPSKAAGSEELRSFTVSIPQSSLDDLSRRLVATRWPPAELVSDASQGVQLATIQALIRYWANDYDWRHTEAKLNALPQFVTTIDGLDIHFIHVRSKHETALPLIVTHGWPGSVIEQLKIVAPLTDPTAHGGTEADAFHLVIPSMPGYGFSAKPAAPGWGPVEIAKANIELMRRLGYSHTWHRAATGVP